MKIAIVGAGITGCLLADFLNSASVDVSVFEKSRGCGGRASTKQTDWGQCDLGASIVPAQKAAFVNFMQNLCQQGLASKWPKQVFTSQNDSNNNQSMEHFVSDREYFVFNHKMNGACRHWIKNVNLHTNNLISQIRYLEGKGWQLKSNEVWQAEVFDKVVLTAPWPQSQALIAQSELPITLPVFTQSWTSCWSIALKLQHLVASDIDLLYLRDQPVQTLVRDSAKPLRPQVFTTDTQNNSEIWVAQLANQLSDDLGKEGKDKAIAAAIKGLCEVFDLPDNAVSNTYAHYWRFARLSPGQQPIGLLSQHEHGVYVGGDWSFGASIESAYEAAQALSKAIITSE